MGRTPTNAAKEFMSLAAYKRTWKVISLLAARQEQSIAEYLKTVFADEEAALGDEPVPDSSGKWMRLVVDVQTHRRVKILAGTAGISMGEWVAEMAGREMARQAAKTLAEVAKEREPSHEVSG